MTGPADPGQHDGAALDRTSFTYSVVIPVFNSEKVVGTTVDRVVEVFAAAGLDLELILVNDGSPDRSWDVIRGKAEQYPQVVALDLLHNYGQHHANLAGLRESHGDYVITMDDDLQNPPEEALTLIDAALRGHDLVFGEFMRKQAAPYRQLGSKMIGLLNRRIFGQPADLSVSNYRIIRRDVVDRICASRTAYPYITGQALLYSHDRANVPVRHDPRPVGRSTYSTLRILRLVLTILFSYSSFPLRCTGVRRLPDLLRQPPAGRVVPAAGAARQHRGQGLDDHRRAAVALQRLHDRADVDARRVRRAHAQHRQRRGQLPRREPGRPEPRVSGSPRHLVVIGAQRCGTTYLHDLLADHPQVAMARPARPEPKFFLADDVVDRGVGWYDATYFGHATAATRVLGEKSTSYLERPDAPGRAVSVLGDPLVLVQLRDPVERAISNWAFSTSGGLEERPLADALRAELRGEVRAWDPDRTSVSPYRYLARGRYADELVPWREALGDRLHVTFLEEVTTDRDALTDVYRFLGVDPDHRPAGWAATVNSARQTRSRVPAGLGDGLRGYFAESNRALAALLGRPLPWATTSERSSRA